MMSVQSMPSTLALTNQAVENPEEPVQEVKQPTPKLSSALTNLLTTNQTQDGTASRQQMPQARSESKGVVKVMSPQYSKSVQKTKEHARNYRMQTMTASKVHQSTNLLSSNAKKQQQSSKGKFELPLLSNRSNSKLSLVRNTPSVSQKVMAQAHSTQSHNFLPSKIGQGIMTAQQPLNKPGQGSKNTQSMARMYASQTATSPERGTRGSVGPAAPKLSAQKSPGKSFKNARNAQLSSTLMTTSIVGQGVRKQQFAKTTSL